MKNFIIIIVAVLICFTGCNKKDEQVVRIGYIPALTASQLYVGIAKGYFEEEGIKIELTEIPNGVDVVTAVRGKAVDIGFAIVAPLITSRINGAKIKSIGAATYDCKKIQSNRIILPIDSEIQSAQDLRGKRIAVVVLGATDHFSLLNYLKINGIKEEEVEIVGVPFPEMIFAITSKAVDAAASIEPFITTGVLENKVRAFEHYYSYPPIEVVTALAHEDFINENPELIAKVARIIDRATDFINNEEDEFRKLIPTLGEHGIKFRISKEVADSMIIMGFRNSLTPAGVDAVMDMLIENNALKTRVNFEDIIYSSK